MIFSLLAAHSHRILEDSNDLLKIFKTLYKTPSRVLTKTRGSQRAPRAALQDREGRTTGKEKSTKAYKKHCVLSGTMDEVDMRLHDQRSRGPKFKIGGENGTFPATIMIMEIIKSCKELIE